MDLATALIGIGIAAAVVYAIHERGRRRAFRGPKPSGDRVKDYEREQAERRLAALRESGL